MVNTNHAIDDLTQNCLLISNKIKIHSFRSGASENDTTLIVGGLDWLSVQHFDTIQRVLAK